MVQFLAFHNCQNTSLLIFEVLVLKAPERLGLTTTCGFGLSQLFNVIFVEFILQIAHAHMLMHTYAHAQLIFVMNVFPLVIQLLLGPK